MVLVKKNAALKTIREVAIELNLINKNNLKPKTHVIRFWEKNINILKPALVLNNHRYYSEKEIELLKKIKHLLKDRGLTIRGVNKVLSNEYSVDYNKSNNIKTDNKIKKIKKIIKEIKEII